jgi:hypothetical protein
MIIFLYSSECLNLTKIGDDASMATRIGALKSAACMASTELPKQRLQVMSMVMALYAKDKSAALFSFSSRAKTLARLLIYAISILSCSIDAIVASLCQLSSLVLVTLPFARKTCSAHPSAPLLPCT